MIDCTTVVDAEQIRHAASSLIRRIEPRLCGAGLTLVDVDDSTVIHTRLQAIFNDRPTEPSQRVLHELMMTHAVMAEKMGPGGFDICLKFIVDDIRSILIGGQAHDRNELLHRLQASGGRMVRRADIVSLIDLYASDASERVQTMLKRSIDLAGFGGRLIIERATKAQPSIELIRGYTFRIDHGWPIMTTLVEPRIVVIDGFVESVGELNAFLEQAHAAHEPVCLFVRGLAPDVITTLRMNYDRGTLAVVPIIVRYDLEGINILKDIAVVSGTDIVSSAKGDLISAISFERCPRIESAVISGDRVTLVNKTSCHAVDAHVMQLQTRRASENDDVSRLLDTRIRSLSPNHVIVRLPDDHDFVRNSQAIDRALRAVSAAIDHGLVDEPGISFVPPGLPVGTVVGAIMHSALCVARFMSLGAIITSER